MTDRRGFLGQSLGLLGALALPRPAWPAPSRRLDCVVIGGGFAGVMAARVLRLEGKRVALVEARDRLGGRTLTETGPGGISLDVGGQWIGPTQPRINQLAKELRVPTFRTYNTGRSVLIDGG